MIVKRFEVNERIERERERERSEYQVVLDRMRLFEEKKKTKKNRKETKHMNN